MANSLSHILPYPILNARYTLPISFRVAAGTPTDPTTPDTEFSADGGATFADCAEEITTGGANGMGYLTLTGAETNNRVLLIAAKSANCVTTPVILHCRALASLGTGTLSAGSVSGGTLGTLLAYDVTNCFIMTTGGTGGGGTGGANNQARRILTYNTGTGAFTVSAWETTPSTDTTYSILLPEGVTLGMLKALNPATAGRTLVVDAAGLADANTVKLGPTGSGTAQTARDIGASVLLSSGTGTGQVKLSSGYVAPNWGDVGNPTTTLALTGTTIATTQKVDVDTIKTNPVVNAGTVTFPTNATLASTTNITAGTITTTTNLTNFPSIPVGWITAAGIADGAIDAATFASGALDAVWSAATRTITGGTIGTYTGNTPQTGDAYAIVNSVMYGNAALQGLINTLGGFVDTEVATIVTQTTATAIRDAIGMATANLDAQLLTTDTFIGDQVSNLVDKTNGLVISQGTIGTTGNTTTAIHLPTLPYADDEINNNLLVILDVSTSKYISRWIDDWDGTTKLATVATLPFIPQSSVDVVWIMSVRKPDEAFIRSAIGLATANLDTQLSGIPSAVLAATVDGITVSKAIEVLLATLSNVAVPSGSTVAFKKRNGSTTSLTITYGDEPGERTASVIS